jgi:hypothetical protein
MKADLIREGNEIQTVIYDRIQKEERGTSTRTHRNNAKHDNRVMKTRAVDHHNDHPTFSLSGGNHPEILTQAARQEVRVAVTREGIDEEEIKRIACGQSLQVRRPAMTPQKAYSGFMS